MRFQKQMVDLLLRYSNAKVLVDELRKLLDAPPVQQRLPLEPKQRQNHLDKTEQLKVVESYKRGNSVYDLAREFGITRQTAAAILERHGIKRRYKVLSAEDIKNAGRLYKSGASFQVVADYFGVNPSTIRKSLLGAGFKTRPSGTNQWS